MIRFLFGLLIITTLLTTCSDEFNLLNDDVSIAEGYKKTIIVYCNLSPSNELHFVRVNRGFSAENFYTGANNIDSLQFAPDEVDVKVFRLRNDDTVATYECKDTILQKDESDFFNTGEVIAYYFKEPDLMGGIHMEPIKFAIEVNVNGDKTYAQTDAVKGFNFNYPPNSDNFPGVEFEGEKFKVEINKPENSQTYQVIGIGRYREITEIDGDKDTVLRAFEFSVGSAIDNRPAAIGDKKTFQPSTGIFYDAIERDVKNNGDTIHTIKRKFVDVSYEAIAGNSDLALTQNTGNAFTGFHDNTTNISNVENGLGLFSAYNKSITRYYQLTTGTVDSIISRFGYKYHFGR